MDKFLNIVGGESSPGEIDKANIRKFLYKVPIWEYAKISKAEYTILSKDEQNKLFIMYYNDILLRFGSEGGIWFFFFF